MAADLSGMFAQMNNAIKAQPLPSGVPLDVFSRGAGNLAGTLSGGAIDNYSMMTPEARQAQGRSELGQIKNMSSSGGLEQASSIYNKMGKTEKSIQYGNQARQAAEAENKLADEEIALAEHKKAVKAASDIALGRKDPESSKAILAGVLEPEDYMKTMLTHRLKLVETAAGKDPYAGAFTKDVMRNGKMVPVRFYANGTAIAVLGGGVADNKVVEMYNPAIDGVQSAVVDVNDPTNYTWVGTGKRPEAEYEVKEVNGEFLTWMTLPGEQPILVSRESTMSGAQLKLKHAKTQVDSANLVSSIDSAIAMVNEGAAVGGWYGPTQYLPNSAQREYNTYIDSIRANVGFDQLTELRAAGGTLGQVSNIENMLLQSTVAKLDTWTDGRLMIKSLQKIKNLTERITAASMMTEQEAATSLFIADEGADGLPNGNKIYVVDNETFVMIYPDGSMETIMGSIEE
tara:strand:- start:2959 stop:4329 length:1371 start_codon:yes stop_codon:yes gene_type:complete